MTTAPTIRTAAAARLPVDLATLAGLTDPIGVLSVYADADPALSAGPRPAWQAPVRTRLRRLTEHMRRTPPRFDWQALETRLHELEPEIEELLDPRAGRRGRALFAAVGGDRIHRVQLNAQLTPLVVLDRGACVLPLLAATQDGGPAGAATVSWDELRTWEWELDELEPLETSELGEPVAEPARARTNPAVPQSFPERDRFHGAAGARVVARLREAADELAGTAEERGWDLVVADGDPRLLDVLEQSFHGGPIRVARGSRPLGGVPEAEAAGRVGGTVRTLRAERTAELVGRLGESAAATHDPLVLGRSLDEGRVEQLLIEAPPHPASMPSRELLLRRALATGAEVRIVAPGEADLGPGGAAALLRW